MAVFGVLQKLELESKDDGAGGWGNIFKLRTPCAERSTVNSRLLLLVFTSFLLAGESLVIHLSGRYGRKERSSPSNALWYAQLSPQIA